jgi:hypothetical protein
LEALWFDFYRPRDEFLDRPYVVISGTTIFSDRVLQF